MSKDKRKEASQTNPTHAAQDEAHLRAPVPHEEPDRKVGEEAKGFKQYSVMREGHPVPVTALEVLRHGNRDSQALDILEDIRASVPLVPGQPLPIEKMSLMPVGELVDNFDLVWRQVRSRIERESEPRRSRVLPRMLALEPWLRDLQILQAQRETAGDAGAPANLKTRTCDREGCRGQALRPTDSGSGAWPCEQHRAELDRPVTITVERPTSKAMRTLKPGEGAAVLPGETVRLEAGEHWFLGTGGFRIKHPVLMSTDEKNDIRFSSAGFSVEVESIPTLRERAERGEFDPARVSESHRAPDRTKLATALRQLGQAKIPERFEGPLREIISDLTEGTVNAAMKQRLALIAEVCHGGEIAKALEALA